ncbi:MAG: DNRLRE domain-containing protein, partial [Caldilineaceae bacterium]|nr:DNRLRE domain-containing protein [Caldilineaceae bacterium]
MQQILKSHRIGQLLMLLILGILGACIFLPGTAPVLSAAPSATKTPVADTYVASGAPNQSFHTEQGLWVGNNRSNSIKVRRTLFKFDLSDIPTGSTITAAALVLNLGGTTTNDGPRNIKVSRIVRDTGGDWLANTTEEMTWDRHLQLEPTDLNSSTISVGTGLTEYQWNLAAMVKDWLNDSSRSQYFGLLVQDTNNSDGQHERAFWAKDCLDSSCSSAQRPRLLVEYTVPTSTPTATPTVGATATPTNTPVPTKPPKPTPGISIARLTNSPSGVISKNDEVLYIITFSSNNVKEFELLDLQIEDTIPANAKLVKDSIESNQFYQVKTTGTNPGDKITW